MKYVKEFDSLRAIAVVSVMISHFMGHIRFIEVLGSCGVTLFFVLSGYLITGILLKDKEALSVDYKNNTGIIGQLLTVFYIKRSIRIFPIYYLTLLVLVF